MRIYEVEIYGMTVAMHFIAKDLEDLMDQLSGYGEPQSIMWVADVQDPKKIIDSH